MMTSVLPVSRFAPFGKGENPKDCRSPEEMTSYYRHEFGPTPLLVVTNREPVVWEKGGVLTLPPGGVSQTIHRLLGRVGGEWIALRDSAGPDLLRIPPPGGSPDSPGYLLRRIAISEEIRQAHYAGFSNGVLWPFFHDERSRVDQSRDYFPAYSHVNRRLAGQIMESLTTCPAGAVWIHDYQLALVAREIRRMAGHNLPPMAYFWHIPWVGTSDAESLNEYPWLKPLVDALLCYDHIGFQTEQYRSHFLDTVRLLHGDRVFWDGQILSLLTGAGIRTVSLGVHPVSIDSDYFHALSTDPDGVRAANEILRETNLLGPNGEMAPFLISVERMDYSKGFLERMAILESLFLNHPSWIGKLSLLQVAPPSRQNVESYRHYGNQVREAVDRLNSRFRRKDWIPVRTLSRSLDQSILAPLYRLASGALITATRDGMNLVAKEFLASQKGRDGVLFLSRHTGAAQTMEGISLIDPFDPHLSAHLIHQGLSLDTEIRKHRNARVQAELERNNVYKWMLDNLRALRDCPVPAER